jgi:hypothetical protein
MRRLSILLSTVAAIALAGAASYAANIPLISGAAVPACEEASQTVNCLNNLITNINSGVSGVVAAYVSPTGSIAAITTQQSLAQVTIPTGTFVSAGQSLRMRCAGYHGTNTDSAKVGIVFGGAPLTAAMQVSSAAITTTGQAWELELVVTAATNPPTANSVWFGRGSTGTTVIAATASQDTVSTDNLATGQVAACVATTAGTLDDIVLDDFIIEQVK